MRNFLKKIIQGNNETPSSICLTAFNENFEDAINIEWFKKDNYFEAVFYKNNLEHIAMFSLSGFLLEYKLNLPENYIPKPIQKIVDEAGEIMSTVKKNKGNQIEYEIIVRNINLKRQLIRLTDLGEIIETKEL